MIVNFFSLLIMVNFLIINTAELFLLIVFTPHKIYLLKTWKSSIHLAMEYKQFVK